MPELALERLSDRALTVSVDGAQTARALAEHLRRDPWLDVVAGLESVAVLFDPAGLSLAQAEELLAQQLASFSPSEAPQAGGDIIIPVRYGGEAGPDLAVVAERAGVAEADIIAMHTSSVYTVSVVGFLPGFAYLEGLNEALATPRRAQPRPRVAAGSVGIGGALSGIYSLPGPGGWNIIGRTELTLFDPQAEEPFTLKAGMRVRFKPL
ncbi:5-oxoprolinase subunit PxpB [Parvularcula sp. ZS-1/3]|uniref:5-oxoprolinase subunit PxpB n=1 Tax=Parvularcula mediterranea TaxID=2732508 RepID=A0A7Y3RIL2_9PROT|nr:5-oxoprolinase subunit PxpB [Parvularcula mediterranea]NNU14764.1 5-oxoprolinase subunit PxpB [Parvularcula mediterranea]